jgi:hypothetical protein
VTTEMGPRDGDVSWRHRLAGYSVKGAVAFMNAASDNAHGRYDRAKALVSLYGESEDAGDAFVRGRSVSALTSIAMLGPILLIMLCLVAGAVTQALFGAAIAAIPMTVGFVVNVLALINAAALLGLTKHIGVIDHTTEPAPDELDELKGEFVDGEIDEAELGERAAEVWER